MTDQTGATVTYPWPGPECEGVDPMGRGRAKAKQTKVARDLKYRTHEADFGALARELHGETDSDTTEETVDDAADEWSDYPEPSRD
jgi:Protein of unknown function (DUF3073)